MESPINFIVKVKELFLYMKKSKTNVDDICIYMKESKTNVDDICSIYIILKK